MPARLISIVVDLYHTFFMFSFLAIV
jgi:hypothetical protein